MMIVETRRRFGWTLTALAGLTFVGAPAVSQHAPPEVTTSFELAEATAGLLGERSAEIESAMAEELAEAARQQFAFLDWKAGSSEAGPRVLARMVETDAICQPILDLELLYVLDGQEQTVPDLPRERLFDSCADGRSLQSTEEIDAFRARIEETLGRFFDTQAKRQAIQSAFTSQIQLSDQLDIRHEEHAILAPFDWRELRASKASKIEVTFVLSFPPNTTPKSRSFLLSPLPELADPAAVGTPGLCLIEPFSIFGLIEIAQATNYHEGLTQLFSHISDGVGLYMVDYRLDPNAEHRTTGSDAVRTF